MPLTKPLPSAETRKAFQDGLAELNELGRLPEGLPPEDTPQQIFILDIHQIAAGAGLGDARPAVWQFLLGGSSGPAVAAAVGHPPAGTLPRMTSLARGPLINKAIQATLDVEKLPQVRDHDYELRRVAIAELCIRAFWLKSLEGRVDLAIPYHHAETDKLELMRAYPADDFMAIVRRLAKRRLKHDEAARPKK
jgi:hypothetical protein